VAYGVRTRRLQGQGLEEGASTRRLVHAAQLMRQGLPFALACRVAVVDAVSDEPEAREVLLAALDASC
jgi:nitric oxide reductase NorQ protein